MGATRPPRAEVRQSTWTWQQHYPQHLAGSYKTATLKLADIDAAVAAYFLPSRFRMGSSSSRSRRVKAGAGCSHCRASPGRRLATAVDGAAAERRQAAAVRQEPEERGRDSVPWPTRWRPGGFVGWSSVTHGCGHGLGQGIAPSCRERQSNTPRAPDIGRDIASWFDSSARSQKVLQTLSWRRLPSDGVATSAPRMSW